MRASTSADGRRRRRADGSRVVAWLFAAVLLGEVVGGMVGMIESPPHAESAVERVGRPDQAPDDDEHDPLVAWGLLGMFLGALAGAGMFFFAWAVVRVHERGAAPPVTQGASRR